MIPDENRAPENGQNENRGHVSVTGASGFFGPVPEYLMMFQFIELCSVRMIEKPYLTFPTEMLE